MTLTIEQIEKFNFGEEPLKDEDPKKIKKLEKVNGKYTVDSIESLLSGDIPEPESEGFSYRPEVYLNQAEKNIPKPEPLPKGQLTTTQAPTEVPAGEDRGLSSIKRDIVWGVNKAIDLYTGESKMTDETRNAPELIKLIPDVRYGHIQGSLNKSVNLDLSKFTTEEQRNNLSKALTFGSSRDQMRDVMEDVFPDARFKVDENDTLIMNLNGETIVLNKPGWSAQDFQENIFDFITGLAVSPMVGLVKAGVARVGASFAIEAGLNFTKQYLSGKDIEDLNPQEAIFMGLLGSAPDAVAAGLSSRFNKKLRDQYKTKSTWNNITDTFKSKAMRYTEEFETGAARKAAQENIVKGLKFESLMEKETLSPLQLTLDPTDISQFGRSVEYMPYRALQALKEDYIKKVPEIADQYLKSLTNVEGLAKIPSKVKAAVRKHATQFWKNEKKLADTVYKGALKDKTPVDIYPAMLALREAIAKQKIGENDRIGEAVIKYLAVFNEEAGGVKKTVAGLHTAKTELNKVMRNLSKDDTNLLGILGAFRDNVSDIMSKSSKEYAKSTKEYKRTIQPIIDEYQEGTMRSLNNIQKFNKGQIVEKMFSEGIAKPSELKKVKGALDKIDPSLFKGALASHINVRRARVKIPDMDTMDAKEIVKVFSEIENAVFGSAKERGVISNILEGKDKETYDLFYHAMKAIKGQWENAMPGIGKGFSKQGVDQLEKLGITKEIISSFAFPVAAAMTIPGWGKYILAREAAAAAGSQIKKGVEKRAEKRAINFGYEVFNVRYRNDLLNIKKAGFNTKTGLRLFLKMIHKMNGNYGADTSSMGETMSNMGNAASGVYDFVGSSFGRH